MGHSTFSLNQVSWQKEGLKEMEGVQKVGIRSYWDAILGLGDNLRWIN